MQTKNGVVLEIVAYCQDRLAELELKRYRSSDEDAEVIRLDILLRKYEGKKVGKIAFSYVLLEPLDEEDRVATFVNNYVKENNIAYMDDDFVGDNSCTIYYGDMDGLEQMKHELKAFCDSINTHLFVIVQEI